MSKSIYCAVLGMEGFSSIKDAEALRGVLSQAPCGVQSEVHIYENAGHAFLNSTEEGIERKASLGQGAHNSEAVRLAWSRIFPFLTKHLNA